MCIQSHLESLFQLESKLKAAIAKAETHYVSSLLQQSMEDKSTARIYAHIRYVIKQSLIPPVFFLGTLSASTYAEQADLFKEYFFPSILSSPLFPL